MRPGYRVVWAQCWGVPPQAWDVGNLRHIVAAIGELVEVDDDVEDLRRLDRARGLIRTPWSPWFKEEQLRLLRIPTMLEASSTI